MYKLSKGRSIDGNKKIIIISHIDKCNKEAQKYINYMNVMNICNACFPGAHSIKMNESLVDSISSKCCDEPEVSKAQREVS